MAMFTRRVIQGCLNENAHFVHPATLGDWVSRLNKVSDDYVATEWEVVLLRAFARCGNVLHEPALGKTRVDVVFHSSDGKLKFAADIASISDEPLHKQNPIDRLQDELIRRIRDSNIATGRFLLHVEEQQPIPQRGTGRKRRLLLPAANQFSTFIFTTAFYEYLEEVRRDPQKIKNYNVVNSSPDINLNIQYQPGRGAGAGILSYGTYTGTTVKDNNPLFNRLKDKAKKLRESGYTGLRGIIICDRGSRIFCQMPHWAIYSMREVIDEFFRQNESVAFVVTIGVRPSLPAFGATFHPNFEAKLFVRSIDAEWVKELDSLLTRVVSSLPKIYQTPENAVNELKWNQSPLKTTPFIGGSIVERNKVRISMRELLDLLAGKLDQKRFAANHTVGGAENIFKLYQSQGKVITRTEVEYSQDEDDDWIIFEFADGDPAVTEFKLPILRDEKTRNSD